MNVDASKQSMVHDAPTRPTYVVEHVVATSPVEDPAVERLLCFRVVERLDGLSVVHASVIAELRKEKSGVRFADLRVDLATSDSQVSRFVALAEAVASVTDEIRSAAHDAELSLSWKPSCESEMRIACAAGFGIGQLDTDQALPRREQPFSTWLQDGALELTNPPQHYPVHEKVIDLLTQAMSTPSDVDAQTPSKLYVGKFPEGARDDRLMGPVVPIEIGKGGDEFVESLATIFRERHGLSIDIQPVADIREADYVLRGLETWKSPDPQALDAARRRASAPRALRFVANNESGAILISIVTPNQVRTLDTTPIAAAIRRQSRINGRFPELVTELRFVNEHHRDFRHLSFRASNSVCVPLRFICGPEFETTLLKPDRAPYFEYVNGVTNEVGQYLDRCSLSLLSLLELEQFRTDPILPLYIEAAKRIDAMNDPSSGTGGRKVLTWPARQQAFSGSHNGDARRLMERLGPETTELLVAMTFLSADFLELHYQPEDPKRVFNEIDIGIGTHLLRTFEDVVQIPIRLMGDVEVERLPFASTTIGTNFTNTIQCLALPEFPFSDKAQILMPIRERLDGYYGPDEIWSKR